MSYAYHTTRLDQNVKKHHDTILKLLTHYGIEPIPKHLLDSLFQVPVNVSDLPESYLKYKGRDTKTIIIKIDHKERQVFGRFYTAKCYINFC